MIPLSALGNKAIFSKNLKRYIEKSGKDRRELAEIWGFPYSTVTEWINGKKYPRIDRIEIMADYFGIQKSDLIEDKEISEKKEKTDVASDIVLRLGRDQEFCDAVQLLYQLDEEKLAGVTAMLRSLVK